jgi:immunity protein, SdpI family
MRIMRPVVLNLGLVVLAFAVTAVVYDHLPMLAPTHWNIDGNVDGRIAKPWGPFVLPLTMAALFALLAILPRISPRNYDMTPFSRTYGAIQFAILGYLFFVNTLVLAAGLGWPVSVNRLMPIGLGGLFAFLGNFMGKVTPNFFVGVRTPWTLADPEVWLRTHRFAGWLMMVTGLAVAVAGPLGVGMRWLLGAMILSALVPAVYSYFIYRRLEGHTPRV